MRTIIIEYGSEEIGATLVLCFSSNDTEEVALDGVAGQVLLDSSAAEWGGPGQAPSAAFGSTLTVRGRSVVVVGSRVQLTTYVPKGVPRATYRVQFRQGFGFSDAIKIVPYWASWKSPTCTLRR